MMASSTTTMIPKAAATAADVVKDVVLVRYTPRDEGREGQGEGEERRVLFRKERRYQVCVMLTVASSKYGICARVDWILMGAVNARARRASL